MAHLLDKNFVESVFRFIFTYTQHQSYAEDDKSFKSVMQRIFSLQLPEEITERLKITFNRIKKEQPTFEKVTTAFLINFKEQDEILLTTFQLLLKFSCEDGIRDSP